MKHAPQETAKLDWYVDAEYEEEAFDRAIEQALDRGATVFTGEPWRPFYSVEEAHRSRARLII